MGLDANTRQVVAMVVGDRSEGTARHLWAVLPPGYRDRAVACTDIWIAYRAVVPEERHVAAGKKAGLTYGVERVWCTLHQRTGRLVCQALSFSKYDRNHVCALWHFIRLYNRTHAVPAIRPLPKLHLDGLGVWYCVNRPEVEGDRRPRGVVPVLPPPPAYSTVRSGSTDWRFSRPAASAAGLPVNRPLTRGVRP